MNTHIIPKSEPLVYNGVPITANAEMLSLTDMWIAGGRDDAKRPANWARKEGADFISHMHDVLNVPVGHIIKAERGKGGSTFAHWQIGLAYAKYLSPEFHMWCNQVVRERMEGKSVAVASLPPEILEMIRRDDGISRMLAHKVTGIEGVVQSLAATVAAIASVVQPGQPVLIRSGKTAGQILKSSGFVGMKGLSVWFGNRLEAFGCRMPGNACSEMGLTKARLFDPDKAEMYLDNGGRIAIDQKIAERRGQKKLRLIKGEDA